MSNPTFPIFGTETDQLLLGLMQFGLRDNTFSVEQSVQSPFINWTDLKQSYPLASLYPDIKRYQNVLPSAFYTAVEQSFQQNLFHNESRIKLIQAVVDQLHPIPVVFVKGAAEICEFYQDPYYLGQRIMGDVDLLCLEADLDRIDDILVASGHQFYRFDFPEGMPDSEARIRALQRSGHYVYNIGTNCHLEVHPAVTYAENRHSFPPDFTGAIFQSRRSVNVMGTIIFLPSLEHMMVYTLCHAASSKDNSRMTPKTFSIPESDAAWQQYYQLTNRRFNIRNLHFLLKLHLLLKHCVDKIQWSTVQQLLDQVTNRPLLDYYVSLAALFLGKQFPLSGSLHSIQDLSEFRRHYVASLVTHQLVASN